MSDKTDHIVNLIVAITLKEIVNVAREVKDAGEFYGEIPLFDFARRLEDRANVIERKVEDSLDEMDSGG